MLQFGDNGLFKKSKQAVEKSKLAQIEDSIKMDLMAAYIDAELAGMDKPSTETIKKIVENHGGTIDENNPNIIKLPNGEIKLDGILGDASSDTNNPDEINKTIENLNNRITELNKELETERNEKKELQNQVTELNVQVAEWKKKAEDGEVTIEEKNTQINSLNNEITEKNQALEEKDNKIEELEGNVTTLTNQKTSLEARVEELETKQATGNAKASDVLAGKTFSTANGVGQTGTMVNRGTLNLNFSGSGTVTIQPGYYSGGTISSGLIGNDIISQITGTETENTAVTIGGETVWVPAGFTISPESTASVSNGIVVKDKKGNEWVWVPCTDFSRKAFKNENITSTYTEAMPSDQNASVTKYGGYYIGRYEAGKDGSDNVIIQKNKTPYNNIAIADCKTKSSSFAGNNNYDTNKMFTVLCSSYAWDSALNFIAKIHSTYPTNSPQGNYKDTEYVTGSKLMNTGLTTPVCNIYDMGGNLYEYTTESSSRTDSPYVERGGYYNYNASISPAGYRGNNNGIAGSPFGFRPTLFLK